MWHIYRLKEAFDTVLIIISYQQCNYCSSYNPDEVNTFCQTQAPGVFDVVCGSMLKGKKQKKLIIVIRNVSILHSLSVCSSQDLIQSLF